MKTKHAFRSRNFTRALRLESLERRLLLAVDLDDALSEATLLGAISTAATTVNSSLTPDVDVDMYRFTVTAGQVVDFDIDTALERPWRPGFVPPTVQRAGSADCTPTTTRRPPAKTCVGYDAYLRYTFTTAGTYYVGVSNANNRQYNSLTGDGDTAGG